MYGVIDIGTTGVKLFIYDKEGALKYFHKTPLEFMKLKTNYVEQDSGRLWDIIMIYLKKLKKEDIKYMGLSTYRASVVVWDKTGKPLTNIITWIDRRGMYVLSGLPIYLKLLSKFPQLNAIFSPDSPAILYKWLLLNYPNLKKKIENGKAYFGTLDSYIAYRLTGEYVTDVTNATLTGLIHPKTLKPIKVVNMLLGLPLYNARVVSNTEPLGEVEGMVFTVLIGDQQAAALAEGCLKKGCIKITNGTGSFVDMILPKFKMPKNGLIPIVVVKTNDFLLYGVEGFLPSSGVVLDWMVKKRIIKSYEEICMDKFSGENLFFLPMFRGLRIPSHPSSSGVIFGLSLKSNTIDIARGFINGVAFLIQEIFQEMMRQFNHNPDAIYCDGGFSRCNKLVQTIADYTGFNVFRSHDVEGSGRGVLKLLEIASGKLSFNDINKPEHTTDLFTPSIDEHDRIEIIKKWQHALEVGLKWSL